MRRNTALRNHATRSAARPLRFPESMLQAYARRMFLLAVLVGAASGCDANEEPPPVNILVPRAVAANAYVTTDSGLKYYDFVVGDGNQADSTHRITVHYAGWLENENLVGSSYALNAPLTISLASDAVIDGWVEGIPGMREGGERQLVIPPELAYGETGFREVGIPPNATLIYEIELLDIEDEDGDDDDDNDDDDG